MLLTPYLVLPELSVNSCKQLMVASGNAPEKYLDQPDDFCERSALIWQQFDLLNSLSSSLCPGVVFHGLENSLDLLNKSSSKNPKES